MLSACFLAMILLPDSRTEFGLPFATGFPSGPQRVSLGVTRCINEERQVAVWGVVLLILAGAVIVFGLVLYGNGVGAVPDEPAREPAATRRGLSRISWKDLFARMKTSVRDMTNDEAGRDQKLTATGAFSVMVGLILVVIALLALIGGLLV
jgi:hypothetical protein